MLSTTQLLASTDSGSRQFVDLHVRAWEWAALLALLVACLLVDLLVLHREAHEIGTREAAWESALWISVGVGFGGIVWGGWGGAAAGEYISGYLIEKSLSVDNVFVWALLLSYFQVPRRYQHRVLFWGIFGALIMRAIFIFAGVALIERFSWILYLFGGFLLFTAVRMLVSEDHEMDPSQSKMLGLIRKVVPSSPNSTVNASSPTSADDGSPHPLFAVLPSSNSPT
ncbi:MAG: hypothetical protein R2705_24665 [Ilumatobacteraceae bacterium]